MLYELNDLIEGSVIKRPSKHIKTPYVADVLPLNLSEEILAHTASLGCCGLADAGASILMTPMPIPKNKNAKQKCQYRVYLSIHKEGNNEVIIGIHPKLAEDLTENALKLGLLSKLQNVKSYKRETTIFVEGKVDSRFDFSGIDTNGIPFIMEVKNVPLADYEDMTAKERKKMDFTGRNFNSKVAYFPDGYRKKSTDPVSPRALKHLRELTLIKKESKTRCIMCYVIQRTDVDRFQPSIIDPEYREAFIEARNSGVEIITMVVQWTRDGEARFICDDLKINI
uniref:Sugar fermentation stimulation protein C-terminal domain-containing protein n=1 Tax=viral metagenome TaxID=1070528 RepID=A0A6C0DSS1_9ZZZZ